VAVPTPIANAAILLNNVTFVPNPTVNPAVASVPAMRAMTSCVRTAAMSTSVIYAKRVSVGIAMKNKTYPLSIVLSATRPFVTIVAKFPFVVSVSRQCVKHVP
jgi:hypothetical protein